MVGRRTILAFFATFLAINVVQVAAQAPGGVGNNGLNDASTNSTGSSSSNTVESPVGDAAVLQIQDAIAIDNGTNTSTGAPSSQSSTNTGAPSSLNSTGTGAPPAQNTSSGGVSARLSAAKFIAGLFWSSQTTGMHRRCSATIISETLLVTSGACAQDQNPISKFGDGEWRIIAGTDDRFLDAPAASVPSNRVAAVKISKCANFASILLSEPLTMGESVGPILLSNSPIHDTTTVVTYNTTDPAADPLVILTPAPDEECELLFPGYSKRGLLCTLPVSKQSVTADYLGGNPIIGFVQQGDVAQPVLFGVTGFYYSTIAEAQAAQANDPSAYRYNPLVAQQVGKLATLGGLDPQKIATPATPI